MLKSDFFYTLPEELIAQTPAEPRHSSRLLKINRASGEVSHEMFCDLPKFLERGDLLILNDSRVFPARIFGTKRESGIQIEFLLLAQKSISPCEWTAIAKPSRRLKRGTVVDFHGGVTAEILENDKEDESKISIVFDYPKHFSNFYEVLDQLGETPLPPYIGEKCEDKARYNTVYCRENGSAAAPTAGLHFSAETFAELAERGVETAFVTLHVGLGTFRPVKADNILEHHMHAENYAVPPETAEKIRKARECGARVIAVGTTSCRVLESAAEKILSGKENIGGSTEIFIYPSYEFKLTDGLLTNFHLPESTLIMLVSAFWERQKILEAYETAIKEKYRFFSFGDCMLLL